MYPLALFYSAELPLVLSLPYTPIIYYGGFCCSSMLKQVNTCLPFLQLLNYSKPPTAVGPQSAICMCICCCFLTKCIETFTKLTTSLHVSWKRTPKQNISKQAKIIRLGIISLNDQPSWFAPQPFSALGSKLQRRCMPKTSGKTTNYFAFFVKKKKHRGVYCYRKWRHIPSECVVPCACGLRHRNWIATERKTKAYKENRRGTSSHEQYRSTYFGTYFWYLVSSLAQTGLALATAQEQVCFGAIAQSTATTSSSEMICT